MRSAFSNAMRDVQPTGSREQVIAKIAKAVASEPTVLAWFQAYLLENASFGYHTLEDAIGDPLFRWKQSFDVDDDPRLDSLSRDADLKVAVQQAVMNAPPVVALILKPDFAMALAEVPMLRDALAQLDRQSVPKKRDLDRAKESCMKILSILSEA